jgi:hypothetical protein
MGKPAEHASVMIVTAIFSRHDEALTWAKKQAIQHWGKLELESSVILFSDTKYYEREMGSEIKFQLLAFAERRPPSALPDMKLTANRLEVEYAALGAHEESRPLNIDPGYVTPAKFVLATTKDASHRLYLGHGIFAEVTLYYAHKKWNCWPWTYPNYKHKEHQDFLTQCRDTLLAEQRLKPEAKALCH